MRKEEKMNGTCGWVRGGRFTLHSARDKLRERHKQRPKAY